MRTAAERQARACLIANTAAIGQTQPNLLSALPAVPDRLEWVFGRDGSLTAREDDCWISGCSLPQHTADHLLRTLNLRGVVGCFLNPNHAAQIRAALNRTSSEQSIIALVRDEAAFHLMLHCEDFSSDIARGRLWFVTGLKWEDQLRQLLQNRSGLPIPGQFIRTALTDPEQMHQWIESAQSIFTAETARRERDGADLCRRWRSDNAGKSWCVLAGSRFKLWNGAPQALYEQLLADGAALSRYDPDHPTTASPWALVQSATECRGMIMADLARGDFPSLLPMQMPWITWITGPRIPNFPAAGPNDRLLLADPAWVKRAQEAGWPQDRLAIALWPQRSTAAANELRTASRGHLALLIDTHPIDLEPDMELSSHRLLWQAIANEIAADPFGIAPDAASYLHEHRQRMNISEEGFDAPRFITQLILPAYQQAVAGLLIQNKLPLRLWGAGWNQMDEFKPFSAGGIDTQADFTSAVSGAAVLVHPLPVPSQSHEIDTCNRPVLRPPGRRKESFIQAARQILNTPLQAPQPSRFPSLTAQTILSILPQGHSDPSR
jgi:hypothetical protein